MARWRRAYLVAWEGLAQEGALAAAARAHVPRAELPRRHVLDNRARAPPPPLSPRSACFAAWRPPDENKR